MLIHKSERDLNSRFLDFQSSALVSFPVSSINLIIVLNSLYKKVLISLSNVSFFEMKKIFF